MNIDQEKMIVEALPSLYPLKNFEEEAIHAVLDAIPKWIPVTERLPEYGKAVLTMNKDGDYEINHIIDDEEGDFFYYGAIAWMPLPEPYKED